MILRSACVVFRLRNDGSEHGFAFPAAGQASLCGCRETGVESRDEGSNRYPQPEQFIWSALCRSSIRRRGRSSQRANEARSAFGDPLSCWGTSIGLKPLRRPSTRTAGYEQVSRHCCKYGQAISLGDIGYVDEEGFLYIVDRIKELIKVKGLQVRSLVNCADISAT